MSEPTPSSFKVGSGRLSVRVSRWKNPAGRLMWRFRSPVDGRDIRRVKRNQITALAREHLQALDLEEARFLHLTRAHKALLIQVLDKLPTPAHLQAYLDHVDTQPQLLTLPNLVAAYIAHKTTERGELTQHLRSVQIDLDTLAHAHPSRTLSQLTTPQLFTWHQDRTGTAGAKRRNDCRTNLLSLYNYALKQGEIPVGGNLIAQRLPIAALPVKSDIRYANRGETLFLLNHIAPEYRLWLVLGLFAGLRPEEIIPEKNRKRPGLDRGAISLETGTIYISREVAGKVGTARRIPITDSLKAWLPWAGWQPGQTGPIGTKTPARAEETLRLGSLMDDEYQRTEGWPKDFLRHTYASHRNAIINNLAQLSIELGNSVAILQRHYNQPLPAQEGKDYFDLRPIHLTQETIIPIKLA